jgi:hypothetical protein
LTVTPQDDTEFGASSDEVEVEQTTEVPEAKGESAEELTNDEVEDDGAGDESVSDEQDVTEDQPKFTVTIDGTEVEVTLDELRNGYSRQADYTRKTQALAAERERLAAVAQLAEALEADPAGTLQALQKAFADQLGGGTEVELDPNEELLRRHEAFIQRQEAAAREAQIVGEATAALAAMQLPEATYTPAAGLNAGVVLKGPEALLQYALDNQIGNLTVAARLLRTEQPKGTVNVVARTEQKRAAAVVDGGRSKAPATTAPAKAKKVSLREAFEMAKAAQS